MVVYGFMNDADFMEFCGAALAIAPFVVRNHIETTRKQNSISMHGTH